MHVTEPPAFALPGINVPYSQNREPIPEWPGETHLSHVLLEGR